MQALIVPVRGYTPILGEKVWLAPNATIIGQVHCGNQCTFWFGCVVRGDVNSITIGNQVNIQDGAVIHGTFEKAATLIGDRVSIGHKAMIHGCTIENDVLIGMGAIILDNAHIGHHSIIAAGAVVLENTQVEPYSIYAGIPAKKVKTLSQTQIEETIQRIANNYVRYASWFESTLSESELNGWQKETKGLYKKFTFENYQSLIQFVNQIAVQAELQNHHPTLHFTYNSIEIWICTHDANHQITEKDYTLANAIDALRSM